MIRVPVQARRTWSSTIAGNVYTGRPRTARSSDPAEDGHAERVDGGGAAVRIGAARRRLAAVCDAHAGLLALEPANRPGRGAGLIVAGASERGSVTTRRWPAMGPSTSASSRHHPVERWKADILDKHPLGAAPARLFRWLGGGAPDGAGLRQRRGPGRGRVLRGGGGGALRGPSRASGSPGRAPVSGTSRSRELPGYPADISRGSDGRIWRRSPRGNPMAEWIGAPPAVAHGGHPVARGLQPTPARTARVMSFDPMAPCRRPRVRRPRLPHGHGVRQHGGRRGWAAWSSPPWPTSILESQRVASGLRHPHERVVVGLTGDGVVFAAHS